MTKTIKYLFLLGLLINIVQASNPNKTLKQHKMEQKVRFSSKRKQQYQQESQKRGYLSTIPKRKKPSKKKSIMTVNDLKLKNAQETLSAECKRIIRRFENHNKTLRNMIKKLKHRNAVGDEELKRLDQKEEMQKK